MHKIKEKNIETKKTIGIKTFCFLAFILSPAFVFGQGQPLSSEAASIQRDILLTNETVLYQRSALSQKKGLHSLNDIKSIKMHNQKEASQMLPAHKTLFNRFNAPIASLSNKDEKLLLTIFLEREIINLTSGSYSEADYITVKKELHNLNKLSKSSLKNCSLRYLLIGDSYSFIMQYEGGASFIKNGPKAQKSYKKAYSLDKQNYAALLGISAGDLFTPKIAGGNIKRAMQNFSLISRSSSLKSERYFSLFFLGLGLEKQKQRAMAIETWERAEMIFPGLIAGQLLRVIEIGEEPETFMAEN